MRFFARIAAIGAVCFAGFPIAGAADFDTRFVSDPTPSWGIEARLGAFAHGVGGPEERTVDLAAELIFAKPFEVEGFWNYFIPRPHIGGSLNLDGKTSFVYGGAVWRTPTFYNFFGEGFFGGAVHNGELMDPLRAQLGCNPLFHVGGSLGYQLSPRWDILATFEHLSNGKGIFHTDCPQNEGLNNYGLRIGYSF